MNPYDTLPSRAFWRTAVAVPGPSGIGDLWRPKFRIGRQDPVLTAGSCFAAHLGRVLLDRGMNWRDAEPAPPGLSEDERRARQYGQFSFRTGNIYTAALLRQWFEWAWDPTTQPKESWPENGRHFDPYRPSVEPDGYPSAEAMLAARQTTLTAIRDALGDASCLIFTLGLTEGWRDAVDGTVYPICPGTVRGRFDADRHVLHNFTFDKVSRDLMAAIAIARSANPGLRIVLTVSPVPLTATASSEHVLVANTYSKSVLRAVAGQLAYQHEYIDYFPSYDIVTGFPFRAMCYDANLRTVSPEGVAFVMGHFVDAFTQGRAEERRPVGFMSNDEDFCDDAILDYYNNG